MIQASTHRAARRAVLVLLCLLLTPLSFVADDDALGAETIAGQIVDANSGKPIPFVNLGVPNASLGTVSDREGRFRLVGLRKDSTLVFSAIGYAPKSVPFSVWPVDNVLPLAPVDLGQRENVTVTAKAKGKAREFGSVYKVPGYGFGFSSGHLGAEVAAHIRIKKPTYIESAHFAITRPGGESFLYRVNLYDFSDGKVGANLLTKNVIVAEEQKRGTVQVDLREHGLIVESDVLLSLEWIQSDAELGNERVMFRAKPKVKASLYFKPASQMQFIKVPRHGIGFYLKGAPLD